MRHCNSCNQDKNESEFNKRNTRKHGLDYKCKVCRRAYKKLHSSYENKEKQYLRRKRHYEKNKKRVRELEKISHKRYRLKNKDKINAQYSRYRKNNAGKVNAYNKTRFCKKLKATPSWLTKEQYKEIEYFYLLAKELRWLSEEPLEVDHIVPLNGKEVSGLHVPWNLQILPKSLNRKKRNKL